MRLAVQLVYEKVILKRETNRYKAAGISKKGDNMTDANGQQVVNENEEKAAIILPVEEYEKMKEDLHDMTIVAERSNENTISLEEMKRKL
jgi:PHD/YefM family antitoxin component YafN of YafNO toxin-antitoxin module